MTVSAKSRKTTVSCVSVALLLLLWPLSLIVPFSMTFENTGLELLQSLTLVAGVLFCLYLSIRFPSPLGKWWLTVSGWFLLLLGRELSWGRVFFVTGYTEYGPTILSPAQFPFHREIEITVGVFALFLLISAVRLTPWKTLFQKIPVPQILFAVTILMAVTADLGEKGYFTGGHDDVIIEELAEEMTYLLLILGAWYYAAFLRQLYPYDKKKNF